MVGSTNHLDRLDPGISVSCEASITGKKHDASAARADTQSQTETSIALRPEILLPGPRPEAEGRVLQVLAVEAGRQ